MGKKKFEDQAYDPLAADLLRDAAKVGRAGTVPPPATSAADAGAEPSLERSLPRPPSPRVVELPTAGYSRPEPRAPLKPRREAKEPEQRGALPQRSTRFIAKRFELTRDEDIEFSAFLSRVQKASGVRVPVSVLVRAFCTILQQGEATLTAELRRLPFRKLPSTGDDLGYAEFEERWVELVRTAIRKTTREAAEGLG